ncbi:MAG TPA: beta-ketoacyl synthase N-terminal-like domain-containing protein [Verrucomicrobiae bacterium]|nr:beta-ketoacyl synthase N-terminal-like domain-containing protein [Verrucomicrobiae bacterium]
MAEAVYILGAGRTDFKRNLKKEGKTIRHIIVEAAQAAIGEAGIDPVQIQAGIVGNFASGLYTRQLHLGAFLVEADPKLRGLPTMHVEAACASGGVAVLAGAQQIMGGLRDVVLVVGAEQQKTMAPAQGADVLAAAGDYHAEAPEYGEHMFPKLFARIAQLYEKRYGLTEQQLAQVSQKNHAHARLNPLAQMRDSRLTLKEACSVSEANPRFAPPLKVTDCSQITDGAAAVILCSKRFLKRMAPRERVRLLGYGHATDYLPLAAKDAPDFSIPRKAAADAYDMAGIPPRQIQGAEVHDCFSISEIIAYEILGFAEAGQGGRLAESGAASLSGQRSDAPVVNAGGGLIGDGHPVGATGVRQVVEAYLQLTGKAGQRQINNLRHFLTFNMGGSMTTSVVAIWGCHI